MAHVFDEDKGLWFWAGHRESRWSPHPRNKVMSCSPEQETCGVNRTGHAMQLHKWPMSQLQGCSRPRPVSHADPTQQVPGSSGLDLGTVSAHLGAKSQGHGTHAT